MSKLVVNLEERKMINSKNLEDIIWKKNGEAVEVFQEQISEWGFIGLLNIDFADIKLGLFN